MDVLQPGMGESSEGRMGRCHDNEVNTIPGFTAHSRYPNMMKAAGMSFEQVISALIELAVKR